MWVQSFGWEDPLEEGQLTLVFLPEKSQGQKSLVGFSPWDPKGIENELVTKQQRQYSQRTYLICYVFKM